MFQTGVHEITALVAEGLLSFSNSLFLSYSLELQNSLTAQTDIVSNRAKIASALLSFTAAHCGSFGREGPEDALQES
jgi:hypothetical protein